jgi:hypothetical protein
MDFYPLFFDMKQTGWYRPIYRYALLASSLANIMMEFINWLSKPWISNYIIHINLNAGSF